MTSDTPKPLTQAVTLQPFQAHWANDFAAAKLDIQRLLGPECSQIEHIGSTAIPSIDAKPIIDILIVVNDIDKVDQFNPAFIQSGYTPLGENGIEQRRFFYRYQQHHSLHLHLYQSGNPHIQRHIAFRDYLIAHPNTAKAYSHIKRGLAAQFPQEKQHYIEGKSTFIQMIDYQTGQAQAAQLNASDHIELFDPQAHWGKLAAAEIHAIQHHVNLPYARIEHLGSTAISGLPAKPVLDLFIAVSDINTATQWVTPLFELGYVFWAENPNKQHLRFFKGMPPYGTARSHHLHIMPDNQNFNDRVRFRDILLNNPKRREQYKQLKQQLAKQYQFDRERYTAKKSEFILQTLLALS